jgi:hypothetical protein
VQVLKKEDYDAWNQQKPSHEVIIPCLFPRAIQEQTSSGRKSMNPSFPILSAFLSDETSGWN